MPKYRLLTEEELQLLEKDFVDFLIVNGVTADDWINIKKTDLDKADRFLELFSDVVFEKMMRKTSYVTKILGENLMSFHFGEDSAEMILVKDWKTTKSLDELTEEDVLSSQFQLSRQSKSYQEPRELELFQLIQKGAEVSDGLLHNWLIRLNS